MTESSYSVLKSDYLLVFIILYYLIDYFDYLSIFTNALKKKEFTENFHFLNYFCCINCNIIVHQVINC